MARVVAAFCNLRGNPCSISNDFHELDLKIEDSHSIAEIDQSLPLVRRAVGLLGVKQHVRRARVVDVADEREVAHSLLHTFSLDADARVMDR